MEETRYEAPVYLDISNAPLPTKGTLKHRRNVLYQVGRFIAFNVKMIGMIMLGAH